MSKRRNAVIPSKFRVYGGSNVTADDCWEMERVYKRAKMDEPKYFLFIKFALNYGYTVTLYDAQSTVSKYVTVHNRKKKFKIRWSNHKPNLKREMQGDCDFFVGVTNLGVTTTREAWYAMKKAIGVPDGKAQKE